MNRSTSMLIAGLLYACGIAIISLSPWSDWTWIPESPLAFLWAPWPKYWTGFDVFVNILAYAPFGVLISRSISDRLRYRTLGAAWSLLLTLAAGLLLSIALESLQTYLPSRRSSLMDVLANGFGTFMGAFFSSAYAQNRSRPTIRETTPMEISAVMLLGIWFLAQAAPQPIWLALGDIGIQTDLRSVFTWFAPPTPENPVMEAEVFAAQRILAEALCVASAIISCALIVHLTLLDSSRWFARYAASHWVRTLAIVTVLTLTIRTGWISVLSAVRPDTWFTAGAQAGVILAALSAYGLAGARPTQQRVAAIAGLITTIVLANSLPESSYTSALHVDWSKGRWFNLQALANLAATGWPFVALAWLFFVLPRRAVRALERHPTAHRVTIRPR